MLQVIEWLTVTGVGQESQEQDIELVPVTIWFK